MRLVFVVLFSRYQSIICIKTNLARADVACADKHNYSLPDGIVYRVAKALHRTRENGTGEDLQITSGALSTRIRHDLSGTAAFNFDEFLTPLTMMA